MLLIDTGERQVAERMKSAVYELNESGPKYVINTHLHLDHIGGNSIVGEGATIIDYTNLEQRVSEGLLSPGKGPLRGRTGRAFDTYYSMRFNGEEIRLIPAAGAHSNSDILIHFTDSGIVHMGALLVSDSFPGIGGQLKRYLEILDTTIDVFPTDTTFLAGHGREQNLDQLRKYRKTLQEAIDAVVSHIKAGKSVEQMQQENVLEEWEWLGQWLSFLDTNYWIRAVYNSGIAEQEGS
jgi:glyoxylase-like metal-dependent hydrolase (beta-lactamase superfamily II)